MGKMGQGEPEEDGSDRRALEGTVADRTAAASGVDALELGVKRWADGLDDVHGVVNIARGPNVAAPYWSSPRRSPR
jgi:hypothetical protein